MGKAKYADLMTYGGTYTSAYFLNRCLLIPRQLHGILSPAMIEQGWHDLNLWDRLNEDINDLKDSHFIISALEQQWYMRNQLLRDTDWAGMAHSVEIRVPLVDAELLKSVTRLFPYHPTKKAMASCLDKPLPANILHRKKTGFNVPIREWFMANKQDYKTNNRMLDWAQSCMHMLACEKFK